MIERGYRTIDEICELLKRAKARGFNLEKGCAIESLTIKQLEDLVAPSASAPDAGQPPSLELENQFAAWLVKQHSSYEPRQSLCTLVANFVREISAAPSAPASAAREPRPEPDPMEDACWEFCERYRLNGALYLQEAVPKEYSGPVRLDETLIQFADERVAEQTRQLRSENDSLKREIERLRDRA